MELGISALVVELKSREFSMRPLPNSKQVSIKPVKGTATRARSPVLLSKPWGPKPREPGSGSRPDGLGGVESP